MAIRIQLLPDVLRKSSLHLTSSGPTVRCSSSHCEGYQIDQVEYVGTLNLDLLHGHEYNYKVDLYKSPEFTRAGVDESQSQESLMSVGSILCLLYHHRHLCTCYVQERRSNILLKRTYIES